MRTRVLHLHIQIDATPQEVARVWLRDDGVRESATLEYSHGWLEHPMAYAIDPALPLREGPHQTRTGQRVFGCLTDTAPDRWGRRLMAARVGRERLSEAEVLGMGQDLLRMGALRLFDPEVGQFCAAGQEVPGLDRLPDLARAARAMTMPQHVPGDVHTLGLAGAAMGGANPKAMIRDAGGQLWLAKFSSANDIIDMVRWEALCLMLARAAGVETPQFHLHATSAGACLLLRRFDREEGRRIGYVSGHTLAQAEDGVDYSYAILGDAIVEHGGCPEEDLPKLWERMVFNLAISNQDDHLRNHGFLRRKEGWRLAPAFDLTPTPPRYQKPRHALAVGGDGNNRIEHAMSVAGQFELTPQQASKTLGRIANAISPWREVAASIGIPPRQVSHLAPSIGVRGN